MVLRFVYCRGDETSEYIVDDRGQHELWEQIQKMSDEEKKKYIQNFERKRRKTAVTGACQTFAFLK